LEKNEEEIFKAALVGFTMMNLILSKKCMILNSRKHPI